MDYYALLGVARTATPQEITKSYRKLALLYHPDRNPGDKEAEDSFKAVAAAYEILNDPSKRSLYDRQGFVGRRPPPPPPPKPKPKPEPKKPEKEKKSEDFENVNCTFFGGVSTGRNILTHLFLSKEEMRRGGRFDVAIKRRETCQNCLGDGNKNKFCKRCDGVGRLVSLVNGPEFFDMAPKCETCDGRGVIFISCNQCKGEGIDKIEKRTINVLVPSNCRPGQQITIPGEGEISPFKSPGYVRVVVLEKSVHKES